VVDLAYCCFMRGEIERSVALCNSAIAKFDSLDMKPHPMEPKLRATLSRMMAWTESDAGHRPDSDSNRRDIEFPSRFFGKTVPQRREGEGSPDAAQFHSTLSRIYPDISLANNSGGKPTGPGPGGNIEAMDHSLDYSPRLGPRYAESTFSGADSASTVSTNPHYAESIFSAVLTELSSSSHSSTDYIIAARDEIADLLLTDDDIRALVITALSDPKIGAQRFARNLRRLLIEFSKDLLIEASSPVHKETAKLIRTQSLQIANIVNADMYQPSPSSNQPTSFSYIRGGTRDDPEHLRQKMQSFLASLPPSSAFKQGVFTSILSGAPQDVDGHELDEDEDADGDSDRDFSDEELDMNDSDDVKAITTALEQVKEFLRSGIAMVNLKSRLRSFVTPGAEKREAAPPPKPMGLDAGVEPDREDHEAPSNPLSLDLGVELDMGASVEDCALLSGVSPDPKTPEPPGISAGRMATTNTESESWEVRRELGSLENMSPKQDFPGDRPDCGTVYAALRTPALPKSLPLLLDLISEKLLFFYSEPPLPDGQVRVRWKCVGSPVEKRQRTVTNPAKTCGTRLFDDFVELEPGSLGELQGWLQQSSPDEESGEMDQTTPGLSMGPSIKQVIGFFRRVLVTVPDRRGNTQAIGESTFTAPAPPPIPLEPLNPLLRLLFCIHQGETGLRLHQERLTGVDSDRQLLRFLRAEYNKHRKITSWLTLRSVVGLSLSRVCLSICRSRSA